MEEKNRTNRNLIENQLGAKKISNPKKKLSRKQKKKRKLQQLNEKINLKKARAGVLGVALTQEFGEKVLPMLEREAHARRDAAIDKTAVDTKNITDGSMIGGEVVRAGMTIDDQNKQKEKAEMQRRAQEASKAKQAQERKASLAKKKDSIAKKTIKESAFKRVAQWQIPGYAGYDLGKGLIKRILFGN
ncbi:MAG: hypothetical protein P1V18_01505 [Candidatus Gracilibacteria bacterium]|nr:hypothetical protein [Candidatus Gracilibacteria bacterium]